MKDKIRKLLALAADPGASPQEAETASRQAAALMAKHDIDLADLEEEALRAEFDLTEAQAMGCRPGKTNAVEVPPWIGIIAYGVKVYTRTRVRAGRGVVFFQGTRERIMTEAYGPDHGARSSSVRQSETGRQAGQSAHIPTGRPISHSHLRLR